MIQLLIIVVVIGAMLIAATTEQPKKEFRRTYTSEELNDFCDARDEVNHYIDELDELRYENSLIIEQQIQDRKEEYKNNYR